MQRNPAVNEMDDAAIEAEIDILFAKMEQGLAQMKRKRQESAARWERIDALSAENAAMREETRQLLTNFERSLNVG